MRKKEERYQWGRKDYDERISISMGGSTKVVSESRTMGSGWVCTTTALFRRERKQVSEVRRMRGIWSGFCCVDRLSQCLQALGFIAVVSGVLHS